MALSTKSQVPLFPETARLRPAEWRMDWAWIDVQLSAEHTEESVILAALIAHVSNEFDKKALCNERDLLMSHLASLVCGPNHKTPRARAIELSKVMRRYHSGDWRLACQQPHPVKARATDKIAAVIHMILRYGQVFGLRDKTGRSALELLPILKIALSGGGTLAIEMGAPGTHDRRQLVGTNRNTINCLRVAGEAGAVVPGGEAALGLEHVISDELQRPVLDETWAMLSELVRRFSAPEADPSVLTWLFKCITWEQYERGDERWAHLFGDQADGEKRRF